MSNDAENIAEDEKRPGKKIEAHSRNNEADPLIPKSAQITIVRTFLATYHLNKISWLPGETTRFSEAFANSPRQPRL